jgi:hypothetical protein
MWVTWFSFYLLKQSYTYEKHQITKTISQKLKIISALEKGKNYIHRYCES